VGRSDPSLGASIEELREQLRQREYELALINDVAEQITTQLELAPLLSLVAEKARELIKAERLLIPIINRSRTHYAYEAASGADAELILGQRFPVHIGMCGWVLTHRRPLLFGEGHPWEMDQKTRWEKGKKSALLVPLISRGRIVGGLSGLAKRGGESFTRRDLELLTLFANQASVAIENAQMFRELEDEKQRIEVTLRTIGDAVVRTNQKGIIQYMNPAAARMTGWEHYSPVGGQQNSLLLESEERTISDIEIVMRCVSESERIEESECLLVNAATGRETSVHLSIAPICDTRGSVIGTVIVLRDVTQAKRLERDMAYQATHDGLTLTDLYNRQAFENRLRVLLESTPGSHRQHVLIYIDLDQFKVVNDTCGHLAGDELLRQISSKMRSKIRRHDFLARVGGDEFGLLLENCDAESGLKIAELLRQAISDHQFAWENKSFFVGASIGMVPITSGAGNIEGLLVAADGACYAAKDLGRNRIHIYRPEDDELIRRHGEMQWVPRIKKGIIDDRFTLFAQPICPLAAGGATRHFEILLRLRDEDDEIIPPTAFIPAAERYNKMLEIDRWVLSAALRRFDEFLQTTPNGTISINISGQSLSDASFLGYVTDRLAGSAVCPEAICFEITETAAIRDMTSASRFFEALTAYGCRFALDDFGSGLSSFAYLKHLPVDFLKIDGMFIKDILDDPIDCVLVESINKMAHELGLVTIAEGVSDPRIAKRLVELGVDYGQGYYLGRPEPWPDARSGDSSAAV